MDLREDDPHVDVVAHWVDGIHSAAAFDKLPVSDIGTYEEETYKAVDGALKDGPAWRDVSRKKKLRPTLRCQA